MEEEELLDKRKKMKKRNLAKCIIRNICWRVRNKGEEVKVR